MAKINYEDKTNKFLWNQLINKLFQNYKNLTGSLNSVKEQGWKKIVFGAIKLRNIT